MKNSLVGYPRQCCQNQVTNLNISDNAHSNTNPFKPQRSTDASTKLLKFEEIMSSSFKQLTHKVKTQSGTHAEESLLCKQI